MQGGRFDGPGRGAPQEHALGVWDVSSVHTRRADWSSQGLNCGDGNTRRGE